MEISTLFYLFVGYISDLWTNLDAALTFTFQGLQVHFLSFCLIGILVVAFLKFIRRLV